MALSKADINKHGINDVGDWGEKDDSNVYSRPMVIAGEKVDESKLPAFGGKPQAKRSPRAPVKPA